ncbi:type VI secretion system baseplate subunit TssF [Burkholderia diffusa]|nr:type VI secretion system baseplate subunit TssF [Burkholderia diffusa]
MLRTSTSKPLSPFPSCAIAQFHGDLTSKQTAPRFIPRDAKLIAPAGREVFRMTDEVEIVPLTVAAVRYTTSAIAPRDAALLSDTTGLLTVTFELTSPEATFAIVPDRLRLHFTGARDRRGTHGRRPAVCRTRFRRGRRIRTLEAASGRGIHGRGP